MPSGSATRQSVQRALPAGSARRLSQRERGSRRGTCRADVELGTGVGAAGDVAERRRNGRCRRSGRSRRPTPSSRSGVVSRCCTAAARRRARRAGGPGSRPRAGRPARDGRRAALAGAARRSKGRRDRKKSHPVDRLEAQLVVDQHGDARPLPARRARGSAAAAEAAEHATAARRGGRRAICRWSVVRRAGGGADDPRACSSTQRPASDLAAARGRQSTPSCVSWRRASMPAWCRAQVGDRACAPGRHRDRRVAASARSGAAVATGLLAQADQSVWPRAACRRRGAQAHDPGGPERR